MHKMNCWIYECVLYIGSLFNRVHDPTHLPFQPILSVGLLLFFVVCCFLLFVVFCLVFVWFSEGGKGGVLDSVVSGASVLE